METHYVFPGGDRSQVKEVLNDTADQHPNSTSTCPDHNVHGLKALPSIEYEVGRAVSNHSDGATSGGHWLPIWHLLSVGVLED